MDSEINKMCQQKITTVMLDRRIEHGLEGTRGQDRTCGRTGYEHAADVRDDAGGGDHACANGRRETVGGHDGGATGCENGTASSRRTGDGAIRGKGSRANAMGRSPGTKRRSQGGRFYLR